VDAVGWLKALEFGGIEREVRRRLADAGDPPVESACGVSAISKPLDPDRKLRPAGECCMGVGADRILVVAMRGGFRRRYRRTLLDARLADVSVEWTLRRAGFRRLVILTASDGTVAVDFAPLWYHEVRVLQRAIEGQGPVEPG
jgi:hypothetical protein